MKDMKGKKVFCSACGDEYTETQSVDEAVALYKARGEILKPEDLVNCCHACASIIDKKEKAGSYKKAFEMYTDAEKAHAKKIIEYNMGKVTPPKTTLH